MNYDPNYRDMGRYLRTSEDLGALLATRAEVGAVAARAAAPVDTGEYAASIHVERGPVVKLSSTAPRQSHRVVADAGHSIFVELRDHPLQAAVDAIEGRGE